MDDELEDKIIYQTYMSHVKIMSRIAWSIPLNLSPLTVAHSTNNFWRMFRIYLLKPELLILAVGALLFLILLYIQAVDVWSRNLLGKLQHTIGRRGGSRADKLSYFNNTTADVEKSSWQMKVGPIAAYAVQGRRPKMEDRFVIHENINNTGVSLFAVFDGHGGESAANFAKENLMTNLFNKVIELKQYKHKTAEEERRPSYYNPPKEEPPQSTSPSLTERRKSFRKTSSTTDECIKGAGSNPIVTDIELLSKLDSMARPITREVRPSVARKPSFKKSPTGSYVDKSGTIDYGKLITDEVLAADESLLETAKKSMDVAGTTALIAILEGTKLIVANVGDSRGVMCDNRGTAIPLSFDHKPQQKRERMRIKEAGGFVSFNGVWRVAGILATSRALGDYPLKDKNLVIADPDILSFELKDYKPHFLILASDGLWDTFTNEDAISFVKERLNEADFGARSITLQAYYRGSLDNITVIIINFRDKSFSFHSNTNTTTTTTST